MKFILITYFIVAAFALSPPPERTSVSTTVPSNLGYEVDCEVDAMIETPTPTQTIIDQVVSTALETAAVDPAGEYGYNASPSPSGEPTLINSGDYNSVKNSVIFIALSFLAFI